MRSHFLRAAAGNGGVAYDTDAQAYITAVEDADGEALEVGVKNAYNDFVVGCKADGIWNAIKASCILAGARTLAGALVPLVGPAPTNFNFVAGDYNRETGLVGNNGTKYLNSGRANTADPRNSRHLASYITQKSAGNGGILGTVKNFGGSGMLYIGYGLYITRLTNSASLETASTANPTFYGASRSDSSSYSHRADGVTTSGALASQAPVSGTLNVFTAVNEPTDARISFYSIGEALDLALFDARVSTLMTDLAAAIP